MTRPQRQQSYAKQQRVTVIDRSSGDAVVRDMTFRGAQRLLRGLFPDAVLPSDAAIVADLRRSPVVE